ncbi:hypothetical protein PGTUg99_009668 [Puccinia graminis f. sp. tritici]|uniref:SWIM-type domain-containing protein n=1 Tax=Puccinia graminis f. sp. tritici TaxID=56615 RepID=A0A5B0MPH1_PUCGR|nr:hypothetical protein PGTUg99_009668 [Puccinia graminis f. sp. tritici]
MLYSGDYPKSRMMVYLSKWRPVKWAFADYVDSQWYTHIKHWSLHYRTGIHTNNYTEAWHRVLKTQYISPSERPRINELIQIFCDVVEPNYGRSFCQVNTGFVKQRANRFQKKSKDRAKGYTKAYLEQIGVKIHKYPSHFQIDSFSQPRSLSYRVTYKQPNGVAEGRLLNCKCQHFIKTGSGCVHMYYLAQEYKYLVVEKVPTIQHNNAPIYIEDSDSNVEVVHNSDSANTCKRRNTSIFSPCRSDFPKRSRHEQSQYPNFATAHPAFLTESPQTSAPGPSNLSMVDTQVVDHPLSEKRQYTGMVGKELASGMVSLQRALEALKKLKDRKKMAEMSSSATMNRFQEVCHTLLRMVEERSPGLSQTLPSTFPGVDDTSRMSRSQLGVLINELQAVGWGALKQIDRLLKADKHSKAFVANSTELTMGFFKERCYEIVGMLEEAAILAARVQLR